jgi:uncharacterized cupredoxin-like copper-binding protein
MRQRLVGTALVVAVVLVMTGCGKSDKKDSAAGSGFGKAGVPANAARTVEIHQLDTLRFDPASVNAKPGETITFKVVNDGKQLHEFVLGDQKFQDAHEKDMADMGANDMKMSDQPNYVDVDPGQTKEVTWTFPSNTAKVIYGCHVPGHFKAGMRGTVSVS